MRCIILFLFFIPATGFCQFNSKNSLKVSGDTLFMVNGHPRDRSESPFVVLNPKDIKTVLVVPKREAVALYGSRGAGATMVITTKKASLISDFGPHFIYLDGKWIMRDAFNNKP